MKTLQTLWDLWNAQNEEPRWYDERWNGMRTEYKQAQQERKAAEKPAPKNANRQGVKNAKENKNRNPT